MTLEWDPDRRRWVVGRRDGWWRRLLDWLAGR
jgi:hypothetical protein